MKRFLTIIKYVLMVSIGSLIVFWIIQYNFFHDISRFSINRPADPEIVEIYEARGRFENEKGLEAILKFMNEEYFSKPFVRTREIYIAGAPIIMGWNSDYPSEDVYFYRELLEWNHSTIMKYSPGERVMTAFTNSFVIKEIEKGEYLITSNYSNEIRLEYFFQMGRYVIPFVSKERDETVFRFEFPKRKKRIVFHFYDCGKGYTAKMEDLR